MAMNFRQIERLKSIFTQSAMKGCQIQIASQGVQGRIVGIGYKPLWTSPYDSKLEGLDLNYMDDSGVVKSYFLRDIIGYDMTSHDGEDITKSTNITLELHVLSQTKAASKEPFDKIQLNILSSE